MASRKISTPKPRAFTLIEAAGRARLLTIVGGLGLIMSMDDFRGYSFRSERDTIVSALEKARSQSISNICLERSPTARTASRTRCISPAGSTRSSRATRITIRRKMLAVDEVITGSDAASSFRHDRHRVLRTCCDDDRHGRQYPHHFGHRWQRFLDYYCQPRRPDLLGRPRLLIPMRTRSIYMKGQGFSTLEMLIAMTILSLSLSAAVLLSGGNQSLSVDTQGDLAATGVARKALETQEALARKDFKMVNSTTTVEVGKRDILHQSGASIAGRFLHQKREGERIVAGDLRQKSRRLALLACHELHQCGRGQHLLLEPHRYLRFARQLVGAPNGHALARRAPRRYLRHVSDKRHRRVSKENICRGVDQQYADRAQ